tara:strand:- start:398 stop:565 length:168 start_codon:yes stop_codon:yes gene_type:complete
MRTGETTLENEYLDKVKGLTARNDGSVYGVQKEIEELNEDYVSYIENCIAAALTQ